MSSNTTKQYVGYVIGKKTGGTSGPVSVGTFVYMPILGSRPRDPENNSYPSMVNKTSFPSVKVLGKRTPSIEIMTLLKRTTHTSALLASWIGNFDANNDGDTWAWLLNDGTAAKTWSNRVFDGCKGVAQSLAASAQGGGIGLNMAFIAQTAQGSTDFTGATPATVAGNEYDVSSLDFGDNFIISGLKGTNSTADLVRGWRQNLIRGGSYDFFFNGTLYPAATSSGMLGGNFQLEQSPLYTASPGTSAIIRIGNSSGGVVTPDMTLSMITSHDEDVLDLDAGFGDIFRTYTLADIASGTQPIVWS